MLMLNTSRLEGEMVFVIRTKRGRAVTARRTRGVARTAAKLTTSVETGEREATAALNPSIFNSGYSGSSEL